MGLVIYGALRLVAWIAGGRVKPFEIVIILWFTVTWRLAWAIWIRTVGRWGERWVRWARVRRRQSLPYARIIRLIPIGRALLTAVVFFPAFLSVVVTHRFKIADGQDPRSVFAAPFESIRIPTSDGLELDGWFVLQHGADRTIIICHGAGAGKGNFIWFLGPLLNHGYNVLFFDFRAHGGSGGRQTTYGLRERMDVKAAVDWLKRNRPASARGIVGLGSSQGSMALALAAADDFRIDAIVLDSPFVSPAELAFHHARKVPVIGPAMVRLILAEMSLWTQTNFFAVSAEQAVASMSSRPVLVIHGDKDFVMPDSHAQRLWDAALGPRDIWFGPGPHSNIITEAPYDYAQRLFDFLDQHLGPAERRAPGVRKAAMMGEAPRASQPAHADAPL